MTYLLLQGDARHIPLADESVNCVVTSPPYWGLRDYGVSGQLGLEPTPDEYVAHMVEVFREVRRVLKPTGTCWLNIGDSYASSLRSGRDRAPGVGTDQSIAPVRTGVKWHAGDGSKFRWTIPVSGGEIKPKDLCMIPARVALALQAEGWWLRSDIIWHKPNPMPESVTDRPTRSHEYVFMLTKSARYWYDNEAIKEPVAASTIGRGPVDFGGAKGRDYKPERGDPNFRNGKEQWGRTFDYAESCKTGRNSRDVWTIATSPYKGAHYATMPPKLAERCILAGCPLGGIVFDPFDGSGTTVAVAVKLGRRGIGLDLNPKYLAENAEPRVAAVAPMMALSLGVPDGPH